MELLYRHTKVGKKKDTRYPNHGEITKENKIKYKHLRLKKWERSLDQTEIV